jgi:hypothetical protein
MNREEKMDCRANGEVFFSTIGFYVFNSPYGEKVFPRLYGKQRKE